MYEYENVSEPACEGWWWVRRTDEGGFRPIVAEVARCDGKLSRRDPWTGGWIVPPSDTTWRWTGPIPVPPDVVDRMFMGNLPPEECKPAPPVGAEYRASVADPAIRRDSSENVQVLSEAPKGKPAPSEDEGEKWGKLFYDFYAEEYSALGGSPQRWEDLTPTGDAFTLKAYRAAALRFRDEVLKEERDAHLHYGEGKGITAKEAGEIALRIGEDAERARLEADKPRLSDEELGAWAENTYLAVCRETFLSSRELAEYGAAIRAKLAGE